MKCWDHEKQESLKLIDISISFHPNKFLKIVCHIYSLPKTYVLLSKPDAINLIW